MVVSSSFVLSVGRLRMLGGMSMKQVSAIATQESFARLQAQTMDPDRHSFSPFLCFHEL